MENPYSYNSCLAFVKIFNFFKFVLYINSKDSVWLVAIEIYRQRSNYLLGIELIMLQLCDGTHSTAG